MSERIEPGSPEWHARKKQILADESRQAASWWYLSFAGEDGFHGAVIVWTFGMASAMTEAHRRGINPGGEVAGCQLPEAAWPIAEKLANRLLSRAELEAEGVVTMGEGAVKP